MNVRIDKARDTVEVVNPLTGKIEEATLVKTLKETDSLEVEAVKALEEKTAQAKIMTAQLTFLKSKVTTLTLEDWNIYNDIQA